MIRTSIWKNLTVTQTNDQHTITADVGTDLGGDASALNPHELLEASLGACTSITVMMYARKKAIPLEDVVTTVKILSENGDANAISRKVELKGNLDEATKARLLEIANKCPMHKFLSKKSEIKTELV